MECARAHTHAHTHTVYMTEQAHTHVRDDEKPARARTHTHTHTHTLDMTEHAHIHTLGMMKNLLFVQAGPLCTHTLPHTQLTRLSMDTHTH